MEEDYFISEGHKIMMSIEYLRIMPLHERTIILDPDIYKVLGLEKDKGVKVLRKLQSNEYSYDKKMMRIKIMRDDIVPLSDDLELMIINNQLEYIGCISDTQGYTYSYFLEK